MRRGRAPSASTSSMGVSGLVPCACSLFGKGSRLLDLHFFFYEKNRKQDTRSTKTPHRSVSPKKREGIGTSAMTGRFDGPAPTLASCLASHYELCLYRATRTYGYGTAPFASPLAIQHLGRGIKIACHITLAQGHRSHFPVPSRPSREISTTLTSLHAPEATRIYSQPPLNPRNFICWTHRLFATMPLPELLKYKPQTKQIDTGHWSLALYRLGGTPSLYHVDSLRTLVRQVVSSSPSLSQRQQTLSKQSGRLARVVLGHTATTQNCMA